MKKQFVLVMVLIGLPVCLLIVQPVAANACDNNCNATSLKTTTVAPEEAGTGEEENIDSRIHPFPFGVI